MKKELMKILSNRMIAADTYEMILEGSISSSAKPGQFINISVGDNMLLLRRPISICSIENNTLVIVYKILGKGTKVLSAKNEGEYLDVLGPLGNGFKLIENKKVLLIGGGIGVPPLYELAKQLQGKSEVTFVVGFRGLDDIYYLDKLKEFGEVYYATDDGSTGFKGNVLELIEKEKLEFNLFYACGPTRMLQALDDKYFQKVEGYISFEERMACGFGACTGCVCKSKTIEGKMLRVCKEGPVFELGEIYYE